MRALPAAVTASLCGVLILGGCDSAPGPSSLDGSPPLLSEFAFSPSHVVLNQLPPDRVDGDVVRIPVAFEVTVSDLDGDIDRLGYIVQSPVRQNVPLAEGTIDVPGPGRYEGSAEIRIPKGEVGTYTLLVYAVDREARMSNEVRGTLRFFAEGAPPVVVRVEADPEVVRPPTTFRLVATVTDPDGLENISRVTLTTPNGATRAMFDDGRSSGDETAGDGRFTASFDVPAASPGVQTFRVQAFDRTGLASEVVEKQIRVE